MHLRTPRLTAHLNLMPKGAQGLRCNWRCPPPRGEGLGVGGAFFARSERARSTVIKFPPPARACCARDLPALGEVGLSIIRHDGARRDLPKAGTSFAVL